MSESIFDVVAQAPEDPILGLNEAFKTDPREKKVNLSIGVYCTEEGKVPLLNVVEKAEQKILEVGAPRVLPILTFPFLVCLHSRAAFRSSSSERTPL